MWVDIHLPKGSFFPEMIIDAVVPMADDLPVYEFCYQRVKIKHMGSNLKCVETPEANFEVRDDSAGPLNVRHKFSRKGFTGGSY